LPPVDPAGLLGGTGFCRSVPGELVVLETQPAGGMVVEFPEPRRLLQSFSEDPLEVAARQSSRVDGRRWGTTHRPGNLVDCGPMAQGRCPANRPYLGLARRAGPVVAVGQEYGRSGPAVDLSDAVSGVVRRSPFRIAV